MRIFRGLLIAAVFLAVLDSVYAQRSNRTVRPRHHYSTPKVRGNKAKIICPIFDNSRYPFHGLGFKLGDPFALTYKFYPNKRFSFAADIGKAASGLYNRYFREKFAIYLADTFPTTDAAITYMTHRIKSDLIGEVKALYHVDATKISEGLQLYAGVGWQWKRTHIQYDYQYNQDSSEPQSGDPFGSFDRTRVTMGPQAVVGIEYAYFQIPISAFMEVEYFADVQADPGWRRFEGGVGLRYVF